MITRIGAVFAVLTFILAGFQMLIGFVVVAAALRVSCDGASGHLTPSGKVVEQRFGCERHPELAPWGLAIVGGAGLAMAAVTRRMAPRRSVLAALAVGVGALPAIPIAAVSATVRFPLLLIPVGIIAVLTRPTQQPVPGAKPA